uniref:Aminopeptidase n=1 Tax=Dicentrarchus labrax TaxID=13489 RepID=A0A8C4HYP0_DICLA
MGKVYYVSKNVGLGMLVLAVAALATIIALSIAYDKERAKNRGKPGDEATDSTSMPPPPTTPFIPKEPWDHYRLPDSLVPLSYNVTLWPRLEPDARGMFVFTGHSAVVFRCVKETDLIIIHSNKLNLTTFYGHHAKLTGLGKATVPTIQKSWLVVKTEYLVLQLHSRLAVGSLYLLYTEFLGELADDLQGFYRSEYIEDGVKKVVATSQMQATYARKTFPCFDEPAMKAVFNVIIIHDRATVALSNGRDIGSFEKYINSFLSNILLYILILCETGQGDYALSVTGPILQFYEHYYNATYPLSKSDQIALPDFNAGAMENWGLITYRETALLYDPMLSSTGNKERVTTVISHELAHMWFGNLVTLQWWNDLWLNEGFASYVEYLGADYAEPTWNIKDQIILSDVHKVFAVDALASSHPLSRREEEVNNPAEISEMFNTISYSKVRSSDRISYLNTFAFNNTVYTDLWDHLQKVSMHIPHTVHNIMNHWTLQMGFPVVTIDTRTGILPYPISLQYFSPDINSQMRVSGEDWVLANTNVSGYFRVNYDLYNWDRLLSLLSTNHQALSIINRAQIIDDTFNLARAKIISTTLALRTTKYLSKERDYIPWDSALRNLDYYILMFDRTEVYGALQAYLKKQIQPLFEHFKTITANWTKVPTKHTDQYNQINAVGYACGMGVEGCRELIKSWYRQWMENPHHNPIHPNLKSTVYCSAIAFGGVEEWDFAWRMFKNATLASEASRLRAAMSCTKAPWLLNRYLEYTLDPTKIRKQDATSTIQYVARNIVGMPLAWNFVRARWGYIFQQYGKGSFSFSNLINGITKRFSSEFELQELKKFKEENLHVGFGSATLALEQAIEKTTANIKWVTENKAHVLKWFTEESK